MAFARSRAARHLAILLASAAVVLLSSAFLAGSSPDEEEFRFAVLSAWLRVQSLSSGELAYWTSLLGLGIPQPFVPNFALHPLAPLLGVLSPAGWIRAVLAAHTIVGALGMWRLGAALQTAPVVRSACVATFLLGTPAINYIVTDFWPSHYIAWTLAPWAMLYAWRVLDPATVSVRQPAAVLALLAGIMAANANPAHLIIYLVIVAAFTLAHWRAATRRAGWLLLSAVLAGALAAPTLVQLVTERRHFGSELALSNIPEALPTSAAWEAIAYPITPPPGSRTLWLGGPFAALTLLACVWYARSRADLVLGVALSAVLLFTTWIPVPFASARFHFRDVLTLCAIPLAGIAAHRLLESRRTQPLAVALLALQFASVTSVALPSIRRTWEPEERRATAFRGATGQAPLVDSLLQHMPTPGRLMYSPQVEHDVSERALVVDGIGVNALAYRGIAVVNGSFKAASADAIWPNDRLFYGRVRTSPHLLTSDAALDLLGIRYVLAREAERVAAELHVRASVTTARGVRLHLYENADAGPGAFLVEPSFGDRDLPVHDGCGHDRLLCRSFEELAAHASARGVEVERSAGRIRLQWPESREPVVLVVAEMFRPGWTARTGERTVAPRRMYGALLGVPLPAGENRLELAYRPVGPRAATAAALAAFLVSLALVIVPRQPARPSATAGTSISR